MWQQPQAEGLHREIPTLHRFKFVPFPSDSLFPPNKPHLPYVSAFKFSIYYVMCLKISLMLAEVGSVSILDISVCNGKKISSFDASLRLLVTLFFGI